MADETTTTKTKEEMEAEIKSAMRARVTDFKQQANTSTLEGVRRALETDLGMEKFSLDVHKKFIKQCLNEYFDGAGDETVSKTSEKPTKEAIQSEHDEVSIQDENIQSTEKMDSPSLSERQGFEHAGNLSEDTISSAVKKRATYIRANTEKISLADVRRLLEGDLKLEKNTLDAYKGFIRKEIDEVVLSPKAVEATNGDKKKHIKGFQNKETRKTSAPSKRSSKDSESSDSDDVPSSGEETNEEKMPKKRPTQKRKASTQVLKRQKKSMEESKSSSSRKKKPLDLDLDKSSDDEGGTSSENNHSRSSADERIKKKTEKPTQIYGKQVEHLKSIIKSCGMSVPPSVYKRAKQGPASKREGFLIKELEEILRKEGLSTDPSEKEIKAVKKNKEKAKELEGIDMSNIVSSSRRRSTSSYIPPPKPKIEIESDDGEDEDDEDDEEDAGDGGESSEGSGEDAEDESD